MKKVYSLLIIPALLLGACGSEEAETEAVEETKPAAEEEAIDRDGSGKNEIAETEVAAEDEPFDRDGSNDEGKEEKEEIKTTEDELTAMLEINTDFKTFADTFYSMELSQQEEFFDETMNGETAVNWSGTVLQSQANNVLIYAGDPAKYKGEDWITLMSENVELVPYVINASIPDKELVAEIKHGDTLSVTGKITRAGSQKDPVVWMLEDSLVLE